MKQIPLKSLFAIVLLFLLNGCGGIRQVESSWNGVVKKAAYRGIYINDFKAILGNDALENSLLQWVHKNNFNALSLYMSDILDCGEENPIRKKLAVFIKKARTAYGVMQVAGVASHTKWFAEDQYKQAYLSMEVYNKQHDDTLERFNVFQLEDEWTHHNPSRNFNEFYNKLSVIKTSAQRQSPAVISEVYISSFGSWRPKNKAEKILGVTDRIQLVDYMPVPSFRNIVSDLRTIAKAAAKNGRPANVILIFSAEDDEARDYFSKYGFEEAYNSIHRQYERMKARHNIPEIIEQNIHITGYQVFAYSQARDAR